MKARGSRAAQSVRGRYSWDATARRLEEIITCHTPAESVTARVLPLMGMYGLHRTQTWVPPAGMEVVFSMWTCRPHLGGTVDLSVPLFWDSRFSRS